MLTKDTVQAISLLARLRLTDAEITAFQTQLSSILDHFNEIEAIDTRGVEPLVTPVEISARLRDDKSEMTATPEQMLANAPEKSGHLFKVPPVV
jgi:aspartyl-tRNA(Asn)/glutamyl-tRNA(Gln) amidotransferase subunit C